MKYEEIILSIVKEIQDSIEKMQDSYELLPDNDELFQHFMTLQQQHKQKLDEIKDMLAIHSDNLEEYEDERMRKLKMAYNHYKRYYSSVGLAYELAKNAAEETDPEIWALNEWHWTCDVRDHNTELYQTNMQKVRQRNNLRCQQIYESIESQKLCMNKS